MRTNLIKPKNISEAKSKTSNDGMLDMVIAFDTTGSMAGCIRSVKEYVTAYKEALEFVQSNPIKDYTEGEDRVLRGFKIQFVSRDGKYRCMDMDIEKTEKDTGERLVNINTISQLIYNGVKYTVE